jgi:phosphoserine phosphatase RsbU/P
MEVTCLDELTLGMIREQVGGIILGSVFLFVGLAACMMAAVRRRGAGPVLAWFGVFSAMYGGRLLAQSPAAFSLLPRWMWGWREQIIAILTYLILIPALFFWLELSVGKLRPFLRVLLGIAIVVGVAGAVVALTTASPYRLMAFNNVVAIFFVGTLATVNLIPSLAKRFRYFPSRVLAAGSLFLAAAALHSNLRGFLHLPEYPFLEPLAFGVFILSLGYVTAEKVFGDEKRLLSIESELAIAREIQSSILPNGVPELDHLRIVAAYHPMTAVAGDFYEFIGVDRKRIGLLVADVSGHGVPAALIAAMVKVAMQSVASEAHDPGAVLRGLNQTLSGQLRGQYVTAAYLWIDTETHKAAYSAAGHPPLLRWRGGELERIESNGLLFGVLPDSEYPVCQLGIDAGDRFLLYTDGVTEPENAAGDAFGEGKLEQVMRGHVDSAPRELSDRLLAEVRRWQPGAMQQQDDITLIVVDVV